MPKSNQDSSAEADLNKDQDPSVEADPNEDQDPSDDTDEAPKTKKKAKKAPPIGDFPDDVGVEVRSLVDRANLNIMLRKGRVYTLDKATAKIWCRKHLAEYVNKKDRPKKGTF